MTRRFVDTAAFVIIVGLAGVAVFTVSVLWVSDILAKHSCMDIGRETSIETKYVDSACYINPGGQWIPLDNWKTSS